MIHALVISVLLIFAPKNEANDKFQSISIHEAVAQNLVTVEVNSKGGYSGECIAMTVSPVVYGKYDLKIPAGTHFIAENDPEQDIFVVEDQILVLVEKKPQTYSVEGFCSQADDSSPDTGSEFKMIKSTDEELIKLADYINGKGYSEDTKQSAIWAVSDGETIAAIFDGENEQVEELRSYVCELTERPNPWYNTTQEYHVTESRQIETSPVLIQGQIEYEVTEKGKMRLSVYKEGGELVRDIFTGLAVSYTGETAINFKGKVKGWDKGMYEVKIFINEKEIHMMPFEV